MKKNLILNVCVLCALLASPVYSQEVVEIFDFELEISDQMEASEEIEEISVHATSSLTGTSTSFLSTTTTSTSFHFLDEELFIDSDIESIPFPQTADFLIRNGGDILFQENVAFEYNKTISILDTEGKSHEVASDSALGVLYNADKFSDAFEITDIQFYPAGFGYGDALYLKCIAVNGVKSCDNWQYVINGVSPNVSVDNANVYAGDTIGFYFGTPYQVVFDTSAYFVNVPIVASAEQYNYQNNSWDPRKDVHIGITIPNPDDIWNPIELATYLVDDRGKTTFEIATSGVYKIGITEDYYYPSYTITVASTTATTTATSTNSNTGSGGNTGTQSHLFDIDKAVAFLKNLQANEGSYGGSQLYTDWVAIAFGAVGEKDSALMNYFKSTAKVKNLLTDNERRAMALLALGKNPYDFEGINYIDSIVKEFDGIQFGEKNLVNDDIFALVVLSKVGYKSDDDEVAKTIDFILKKQNANGSWEGSTDLTGASIQALNQYNSVSGVSSAISKAKTYLKNAQQSDGGWGSIYSTSWVMQASASLNEEWTKDIKTGEDYLANSQQEDGGVLSHEETNQNRIWATSYAIPAVPGMSWDDILNSVSKPNSKEEDNTNDQTSTSTANITTSIDEENVVSEVATTTPGLLASSDVLDSVNYAPVQDEKIISNSNSNSKKDIPTQELNQKDDVSENQLASVNQIPWFKTWWVYVLAGIVGGVITLKLLILVFKKF